MRDKKKYAENFFMEYWIKNMPKVLAIPSIQQVGVMLRYAKESGIPIITATQPPVTLVPQPPKNTLLSS